MTCTLVGYARKVLMGQVGLKSISMMSWIGTHDQAQLHLLKNFIFSGR